MRRHKRPVRSWELALRGVSVQWMRFISLAVITSLVSYFVGTDGEALIPSSARVFVQDTLGALLCTTKVTLPRSFLVVRKAAQCVIAIPVRLEATLKA